MKLHDIGQSLWMEHVTREQLYNGLLKQYIEDQRITGLTVDPGACEQVFRKGTVYDCAIRKKLGDGLFGERLALEIILEDTHHAADFMRHVFDCTDGVDGWAALTGSSPLTTDTATLVTAVSTLHAKLRRPNVLITVPGLPEWAEAIELLVFSGIPLDITLLFSCEQYKQAAEAYLRGLKRRIAAGLRPVVVAFASVPIASLIGALSAKLERNAAKEVVIAMARRIYKTSRDFHNSPEWERASNSGARSLRLVWTAGEDGKEYAADNLYFRELAAPFTVVAMPGSIIETYATGADLDAPMPTDGGNCEEILARCRHAGVDLDALTARLQHDEAQSQATTWIKLLEAVARKSASLTQTKRATTSGAH